MLWSTIRGKGLSLILAVQVQRCMLYQSLYHACRALDVCTLLSQFLRLFTGECQLEISSCSGKPCRWPRM